MPSGREQILLGIPTQLRQLAEYALLASILDRRAAVEALLDMTTSLGEEARVLAAVVWAGRISLAATDAADETPFTVPVPLAFGCADETDEVTALAAFVAAVGNEDLEGARLVWRQLDDGGARRLARSVLAAATTVVIDSLGEASA